MTPLSHLWWTSLCLTQQPLSMHCPFSDSGSWVSTCWRWCPEAPQPCLPQAMELFHWGQCGHREPGDKNATGFKIHHYIQEAELQWSRVFSSVIVVWLCSSVSLLSFVQMGQILFVSLTKFRLFLCQIFHVLLCILCVPLMVAIDLWFL